MEQVKILRHSQPTTHLDGSPQPTLLALALRVAASKRLRFGGRSAVHFCLLFVWSSELFGLLLLLLRCCCASPQKLDVEKFIVTCDGLEQSILE